MYNPDGEADIQNQGKKCYARITVSEENPCTSTILQICVAPPSWPADLDGARARSRRRNVAGETGRQSPSNRGRTRADLYASCGHEAPCAVLGALRRAAKHWHGGDKSLAAIHLARMGLPDIGEDAAYRLSLAAELIDAGVAPRDLARELGFDPGSV